MIQKVVLSNNIEADVFKVSGELIGSINKLLIDPYTGIVRSVWLITETNQTVKLPWSVMCFDKSRRVFLLTPSGEAVLNSGSTS